MVDVFPPALVPVLRERFASKSGFLPQVSDEVLVQLLTTVFFAGLETYEGERNPIRVVFIGKSPVDVVMPEGGESGMAPLYRWKVLRFSSPRPFVLSEVVKLAVAGVNDRIFSAVHQLEDGRLVITGLAREGISSDTDPFIKVIASRAGCLSIRSGRERMVEYERGAVLTSGEDLVIAAGPVRRALERTARSAGLDNGDLTDYLAAVRAVVGEMAAHSRGGILIIDPENHPLVGEAAPYRMELDSSLASLLRLARRLGRGGPQPLAPAPLRHLRAEARDTGGASAENDSFRYVLRNSFLSEAERVIEELGALTGIDGATVLNRSLALVAFGVILPVGRGTSVAEALDREGTVTRAADLQSRGTRHRASATYAAEHPGSVVFVASEDGQVRCMFRDPRMTQVLLWRLGPADIQAGNLQGVTPGGLH